MKIKECLSVNLRMTKELFRAAPGYAWAWLAGPTIDTALSLFLMLLYKYIIDLIVYSRGNVKEAALLFALYYGIRLLNSSLSSWLNLDYIPKQNLELSRCYKQLLYRESAKKRADQFHSDEYVNLLYNAVYQDGGSFSYFWESLVWLLNCMIRLIFYVRIFFGLHPALLLLLVLQTAKTMFFTHRTKRLDYLMHRQSMSYNSSFQHIRDVFYLKQYARERHIYPIGKLFIDKYGEDLQKQWKDNLKNWCKKEVCDAISSIIGSAIYLARLALLVYGLANGLLTLGDFNLVFSNFNNASDRLKDVLMFFPEISNESLYMRDIFTVLDSEEHICPKTGSGPRPRAVLEHVSFSYDGEHDVLKDISLDLALDRKIAIVGKNGSGKSTFLKLLLGLYAPTCGTITYTGGDPAITDTSQLFGSMLQDFHTFVLTLSENITLKDELTEEETLKRDEAICFSGLEDKVNSLENGADTPLTDEFTDLGTELSGGEMQKLAIARAYMMDRPVFVLDEPSSSLDPISENRLIDRINRLTAKKGVILVTHNLSYAKNVDLVIVFHDGQIVESGSPDQLIKQDGHFARMVLEQTRTTS